jgi:hypothetical protein
LESTEKVLPPPAPSAAARIACTFCAARTGRAPLSTTIDHRQTPQGIDLKQRSTE